MGQSLLRSGWASGSSDLAKMCSGIRQQCQMACTFDGHCHITLVSSTQAAAASSGDLAALCDIVAQQIHPLVIHFQRFVSTKGALAACWRRTIASASFALSFPRWPVAPRPRAFLLSFLRRPVAPRSRRFWRSFRFCNQLKPPWIKSLRLFQCAFLSPIWRAQRLFYLYWFTSAELLAQVLCSCARSNGG